jgi:hypothetical protein
MNTAAVITVDVREVLVPLQKVFDSGNAKVGEVTDFDLITGWVTITPTLLSRKHYHVPVTLITHIDPHELFLGATEEDLKRDYATPPARTTSVVGQGPGQTAVTVQPSGYSGDAVVVQQARVDELRTELRTHFRVFTSDGLDLGKVREYDPTTGLMMLNKGPFSKHDIVVPISVVESVDTFLGDITLVASKTDMERMTPVNLVQTAAKVAGKS